ncbi:hypothetical protein [Actinomadura decatromicini]|uniref:Uncharacterized protein n=1 Tax=Actinomadura decatromicini TaxID=2604572 RepID=A0A5D3FH73_9ACTN|nr:hypothetical protein [Actinomadura decatromicini]TYK47190.1 hypothetical protein FXF68_25670 [Actinomadura decatromicini]
MPTVPAQHAIVGALATAVTSASAVLLATHADHDLLRSAAMIGILFSTAAGLYVLIDRRITQGIQATTRVEHATNRVVSVESDVLTVLRQQQRNAQHLN